MNKLQSSLTIHYTNNSIFILVNRILIIQTAFLGDVILATPLISELNRLFPNADIDFLVKKGNEALLNNNPKLSCVFTFDKAKGKFKSMRSLINQFRNNKFLRFLFN